MQVAEEEVMVTLCVTAAIGSHSRQMDMHTGQCHDDTNAFQAGSLCTRVS